MRFHISMNMGSKANNLTHNIIAEYPAKSLIDFMDVLSRQDFLFVEEIRRNDKTHEHYSVGALIINTSVVGKVKEYFEKLNKPTD